MVRSHSGPDPCYYRAAAAEQISGLNEAIVSDVAGADVVLMKTKPRVTRQPTTINYTLVCSYTLRLRQGHSSAHTPHLPTPRQIQDGTCIRSSTRTFIFMQHCDALCKFNTQNLILGLRNRDRKVIQKRGLCVISFCHGPRARTHTHAHSCAHTHRHQWCLRKVQWVSLLMLTHPSVKRRPNICSAWLQLLCTPASPDPLRGVRGSRRQ